MTFITGKSFSSVTLELSKQEYFLLIELILSSAHTAVSVCLFQVQMVCSGNCISDDKFIGVRRKLNCFLRTCER